MRANDSLIQFNMSIRREFSMYCTSTGEYNEQFVQKVNIDVTYCRSPLLLHHGSSVCPPHGRKVAFLSIVSFILRIFLRLLLSFFKYVLVVTKASPALTSPHLVGFE
jgi:hypothetical protein